MLDRVWDFFVETLVALFLPMVCTSYVFCGSIFLNVSAREATGLEQAGNVLLTPFQYLFAGREAVQRGDGSWEFIQKFDYDSGLFAKSSASIAALPASLVIGGALKALSFLSEGTRKRHASMLAARTSVEIRSNLERYREMGMDLGDWKSAPIGEPEGYQRRPGDESHMSEAKEGLKAAAEALTKADVLWWVDCGTLLGTYRYGGIIPWDYDIDIAILEPDFENARKALNRIDPNKYIVQDWSGRDHPDTYLKIYIKKTGHWIDVYNYSIDERKRELSYIFSLEENLFFFEWWKMGERRFKKPIAFEVLFPLKRAFFDGVEVFIPNESKPFLQRYYGQNLAPVKIYNGETGRFEKDLSHPYWQQAYVH